MGSAAMVVVMADAAVDVAMATIHGLRVAVISAAPNHGPRDREKPDPPTGRVNAMAEARATRDAMIVADAVAIRAVAAVSPAARARVAAVVTVAPATAVPAARRAASRG